MADDPVPFQFPPATPFAESPPAEEFREPKRKRGPRKVKAEVPKKRGPKPGSKRKSKATTDEYLAGIIDRQPRPPDEIRLLTFTEMAGMLNKLTLALNSVPPSQRKELLTYLLGQQ